MEERDERRRNSTTPEDVEAADVVQAVVDFVDDLVVEEAEPDPGDGDHGEGDGDGGGGGNGAG